MENIINYEDQMSKSLNQGLKLFGIIFLDIIVVFVVTYLFDVQYFFTNGGLVNLNNTTNLIRFSIIISLWILLVSLNYRKARVNHLININFKRTKQMMFTIPLAIIFPLIITYVLYQDIELTVHRQYSLFLYKSSQFEYIALLNTFLQYIYWIIESLIVIMMLDAFHNVGSYIKYNKYIPWAGLVLAFTWGLEQLLTKPNSFLNIFIISMIAGVLYKISNRNFFVLFIYFLVLILLKR